MTNNQETNQGDETMTNATKTSTRETFTVRLTRDDGSVTYKCSRVSLAHAEREAAAWTADGWDALVVKETNPYYRDDQRAWRKAILAGERYYPAERTSR